MMYGFPAVDGPHGGIKIAAEQYDATVDPDAVPRAVTEAEISAMYTAYIAPHFPGVFGQVPANRDLPIHGHARREIHCRSVSQV